LKSNQYSVKVYETTIKDEEKFIEFFDTNYTLFKDHLIIIQGSLSKRIKGYLNKKSLTYLHNIDLPKGRNRKALEEKFLEERRENAVSMQIAETELKKLSSRLQNNLTVLDKMIRSGQEINIDGDLLLLNRVNSGATLNIIGNLIITNVVEGLVCCSGNFMMLTASPKANIIFHGAKVENELLKNKLNRVEFKNNEIIITPVLKKEISWA
jgi:septum site-determining protein MinC